MKEAKSIYIQKGVEEKGREREREREIYQHSPRRVLLLLFGCFIMGGGDLEKCKVAEGHIRRW